MNRKRQKKRINKIKLTCLKRQNSKTQLEDSERRPNIKKYLNSIRKFKFNSRAYKALIFNHNT